MSSPLLSGSTDVATAADVTALTRMEQPKRAAVARLPAKSPRHRYGC